MEGEDQSLCPDGVEEKDGRMCVTSRRIREDMMQELHVCQG